MCVSACLRTAVCPGACQFIHGTSGPQPGPWGGTGNSCVHLISFITFFTERKELERSTFRELTSVLSSGSDTRAAWAPPCGRRRETRRERPGEQRRHNVNDPDSATILSQSQSFKVVAPLQRHTTLRTDCAPRARAGLCTITVAYSRITVRAPHLACVSPAKLTASAPAHSVSLYWSGWKSRQTAASVHLEVGCCVRSRASKVNVGPRMVVV